MAVSQTAGKPDRHQFHGAADAMGQRTLIVEPTMDPDISLAACQKAVTSSGMWMLGGLSNTIVALNKRGDGCPSNSQPTRSPPIPWSGRPRT